MSIYSSTKWRKSSTRVRLQDVEAELGCMKYTPSKLLAVYLGLAYLGLILGEVDDDLLSAKLRTKIIFVLPKHCLLMVETTV